MSFSFSMSFATYPHLVIGDVAQAHVKEADVRLLGGAIILHLDAHHGGGCQDVHFTLIHPGGLLHPPSWKGLALLQP